MLSSGSSLLEAALSYVSKGWKVFPLSGKIPMTRHGVKDASSDIGLINHWWGREGPTGIGIACGKESGFFVLDIDPRNDGDISLAKLECVYGRLPETPVALTGGGGLHYLFRYTSGVKLRGVLAEGIDVKGDGGYIVAPPSIHPNGSSYKWDVFSHPNDVEIAYPPLWLQRKLYKKSRLYGGPEIRTGGASSSQLALRFAQLGWLGPEFGDSKVAVKCPWIDEHSPNHLGEVTGDGFDSSTVILAPTNNSRMGSFRCLHGHCTTRTTEDVCKFLTETLTSRR